MSKAAAYLILIIFSLGIIIPIILNGYGLVLLFVLAIVIFIVLIGWALATIFDPDNTSH